MITSPSLVRARRPASSTSRVLFIHGSLSSRRMWAGYDAALAPRVTEAIDLPGYGLAPALAGAGPCRLSDVVRTIRPPLRAGTPVHVVAHSFGGAVALRLAVESPSLVRTLTLIEPTCLFLLRHMGPGASGALAAIVRIGEAFLGPGCGDHRRFAMARFVDYWNGHGAWASLPPDRQEALLLKSDQVRRDFEVLLGERLPLAALRQMALPTLIVTGTTSPAAALCIAEALRRAAPRASSITVPGAGHMLPMTHAPDLVRILRARLELDDKSDLMAA